MLDATVISIVIPVYNKSSTLEKCIASLLDSNSCLSQCEIVLINDGSFDGSEEICRHLSESHSFIHCFSQNNQGVSAARNRGIEVATGEYILFLDADDELKAGTIDSILSVLSEYGHSFDLLTYPIRYVEANGEERTHKRIKLFNNGSGVYDLEELPSICQTTMNVCVRKTKALAHPFHGNMYLGEDQLFNTTILAERNKIGYCAEAEYIYHRDGESLSSGSNNKPVFAFGQMIELYTQLLDIGVKHPKMKSYCHEMILHNFWWRCSSGSLFPDFGTAQERAINGERLAAIAHSISLDTWCSSYYLTSFQKAYLLKEFDLLPKGLTVEYDNNKFHVLSNSVRLWSGKGPYLHLTKLQAFDDHIAATFVLLSGAFSVDPRTPRMTAMILNKEAPVSLLPSSYEIHDAKAKSTRAWHFYLEFPITSSDHDVSLHLYLDDTEVPITSTIQRLRFTNSRQGSSPNTRYFEHCNISIGKSTLKVRQKKRSGFVRELMRDRRISPDHARTRRRLRTFRKTNKTMKTWLYADLPNSSSANNALSQFLHDAQITDGITRYYITSKTAEIRQTFPSVADKVLEYGSEEHMRAFACADVVLASYLELACFLPCERRDIDYLGDLFAAKTFVYLQHGILHTIMPTYFSYDRHVFDYEVISTDFERRNLITNHYYPSDRLIPSGAPRLDSINSNTAKRKIIYIPSWRSHLVGGRALKRTGNESAFLKSDFFLGVSELIDLVNKSNFLDKYKYVFEVKLHPNMEVYQHLLPVDGIHSLIADDAINVSEYSIVVTDFSSFVYDFYYAGSAIIYFFPDRREFEGGANHYSNLAFNLESGLGPYSENAQDIMTIIERILSETQFCDKPEESPSDFTGRDSFFLHRDGNNCERLYQAIRSICIQS